MNDTIVAKRYAKALLETALEQNLLDRVRAELAALVQAVKATPEAARFFNNPHVPKKDKEAVLQEAMDAIHASPTMRGFLHVVAEKARLSMLHVIRSEFERMADDAAGIIRAKLTTARELGPDAAERIRSRLEAHTGRQVRLEVAVEPALIGGAALQMDSRVLDASIQARLRLLRESLT